jgi:putative ABC transport system ATP-binding protein
MYFADTPILRAERIQRGFGTGSTRTQAVRNINLDLYRGQFNLFMGPSGSGKSTLLAVLSGLLRPESGHVFVHEDNAEVDLWALSASQREHLRLRQFGFIFQGFNLFPALTARQQLEVVLQWGHGLGGRESRRRATAMLTQLGLADRLNKLPTQLSGGEKQRVAIGRALVKRPAICFADEPTSALDWGHGESVVELLRLAAHEHGTTLLVVSHDPRLVPYVDATYHLDDGRLSATDVPALAAH